MEKKPLILLAGGAGFIGTHTAVELINAGYEVVIADNFSNSSPEMVKRVEKIVDCRIPVYNVDISQAGSLDKVFEENVIDAVIHFAACKAVGESVEKPVMYYRNNLDTTLSLLEAMKKFRVHRMIFSSSAAVYGAPKTVPIKENAPVGNCSNPYGRTKFFNEQILLDQAKADCDFSVVLLRYFNPIGAHETGLIGELPNGIPNNLMPYITQTASGIRKQLNVYGSDYPTKDGTGVRDFIHVVDLAKGHVAALKYALSQKGAEIFNLGTGAGYSVLEVISTFETVNGVNIPYVIAPRRPGDIAECYADVSKAERMLGWKAEKTLAEMCRDSWRWQKSQIAEKDETERSTP